mmetsp:Transcript_108/g.317  ORF Transcript_108/g.317 Transcript_108/m.317 type:complete len:113 (+) Transcript_108:1393-1731(+)
MLHGVTPSYKFRTSSRQTAGTLCFLRGQLARLGTPLSHSATTTERGSTSSLSVLTSSHPNGDNPVAKVSQPMLLLSNVFLSPAQRSLVASPYRSYIHSFTLSKALDKSLHVW